MPDAFALTVDIAKNDFSVYTKLVYYFIGGSIMNKKILALCAFMLLAVVLSAQTVQPKKQKIKVEGRANASLYMTEVYKTDNWAEYYFVYEENKNTFDENEAEKIMYEFFSNYKRDNAFSSVEVEDLKGATIGKTTTTMEKRVIFRHVNKR